MRPLTDVRCAVVLLTVLACGARSPLVDEIAAAPAAGTPVSDVVEIAAGGFHTCALWKDGVVRCFGSALYGQLGDGNPKRLTTCPTSDSTSEPCGRSPVRVSGIGPAKHIAAGETHSCAIEQDGRVACWGANSYGELGDGSFVERDAPVIVLSNAAGIAAGVNHTCAILPTGHVSCWGRNDLGQLGDTIEPKRAVPKEVEGVADVIALELGRASSCALRAGGVLTCWGQIGPPRDVASGLRTICVENDGSLACSWSCGPKVAFQSATAGEQAVCGVDEGGALHCWGPLLESNGSTCVCTNPPGRCASSIIPGLASNVAAVSIGFEHVCAVMQDSTVQCFGDDTFGQLGDGSNGAFTMTPRKVVW